MTPTLRPYQIRAIESIRGQLRRGHVMAVAPCGAGKTVLIAEIIRSYLERSRKPAIVIVHRRELVDQTLHKLEAVGIRAGVVMGADSRRADHELVQVCGIQTLARRDAIPPAGLVIIDECHHSASDSYREVLARYPSAIVLGFTATPWRADGAGLAELWPAHVVVATPAELIAAGYLVPADCYAYDSPDLHDVSMSAGDYNQRELAIACDTSVLVGSSVDEYLKHAAGKQALVFPVNCQHSQHLVAAYQSRGVNSAHLDWQTPSKERKQLVDAFRAGTLTVLSSCGVLTEGFDCPAAEVCILDRPTRSLSLFVQMVGRVLRPSPGKSRALVHDHGGNLFRFGFPDDTRDYSPCAEQRALAVQCCLSCGAMVRGWRADGTCPMCGSLQALPAEEREEGEIKRGKDKRIVAGERLGRKEIEEIRNRFLELGRELTPEQADRVSRATREQKAAEYLRLQRVREEKGFKQGFVSHCYREEFGCWPKFTDAELRGVEPAMRSFLPIVKRVSEPDGKAVSGFCRWREPSCSEA
jgi:DNA repair protein RadD